MKKLLIIIKQKFLLFGAGILICLLFGGCGFISNIFGDTAVTGTPAETSGEPSAEPEPYPVTVDGAAINSRPERIVCLSPSLCEIIYEFGENERIAGRGEYCDYPAGLRNIPNMGSGIGIDVGKILEAEPDLLLSSSTIPARDRMVLENAGIAAVTLPAPKNINELGNIYRIMGVILYGSFTGEEDGERVFAEISRVLDNPGVVDFGNFVYITENLSLATGDTLESSVLSCFGKNLAKNGSGYSFDKTELLEKQPDIIILNGIYDIDDLLEDEVFSQLDAVSEKRVIIADNVCFERPSSRLITQIVHIQTEYIIMKG